MNYSDVQRVLSKDKITRDDIISLCELAPYNDEHGKIYKFGGIYLYFWNEVYDVLKPELVLDADYRYNDHNRAYLGVDLFSYQECYDKLKQMSLREQLEWLVKVNKLQQACKLKIKLLTKQL